MHIKQPIGIGSVKDDVVVRPVDGDVARDLQRFAEGLHADHGITLKIRDDHIADGLSRKISVQGGIIQNGGGLAKGILPQSGSKAKARNKDRRVFIKQGRSIFMSL